MGFVKVKWSKIKAEKVEKFMGSYILQIEETKNPLSTVEVTVQKKKERSNPRVKTG